MRRPVAPQNLKRKILKDALRKNEQRDAAFRRIIRSVPKGKVSTYGKVAAAAGYPLYHRAVAKLLRSATLHGLPWQRIVGAGGEIKLRGEAAAEQRLRLNIEGVRFRGKRVNIKIYEHTLRSWDTLNQIQSKTSKATAATVEQRLGTTPKKKACAKRAPLCQKPE
jgi:methylated-DNA-protein-cysteine methyltransferase-like protein